MTEPDTKTDEDNKSKRKSKKLVLSLFVLLFAVCFSLLWLSGKGDQFFKIFTYSVKHSNTVDNLSRNF